MKLTDIWQIKIQKRLHKLNLDEDSFFFGLTLLVGILAGATAVFIEKMVMTLGHYAGTFQSPTPKSLTIGIIFVFASGYITTRLTTWASGSGIPQTKISIVVHHGVIKFKDWGLKLVASILSLSSGVTLGREGPTVAVAAGLGSSFGSIFSLTKSKTKTLVAVGSAAGIAAAFNTPIAAVTFTMEEVLGNMNTKAIGHIIISSVAAAVTSMVLSGGHSMFSVVRYKFEDPKELTLYLIVGVLSALIAPLWVQSILKLRKLRITFFKGHNLTYIMTSFLLLMAFASYDPQILGSGKGLLNEILLNNITNWKTISYLLIVKFFFISLCYSSGISGGLFMPTLFMGGMIGGLVGVAAGYIYPGEFDIGAFALVGMGAYFASVIRAPITSILIIFEMTQDYKIILPLMIANITAYIISGKMIKGSIYEQISEQDGIHLPTKDDYDILETLTVEDAMTKDPKTLNASLCIKDSLVHVHHSSVSGYPVLKNGLLHGIVSTNEIAAAYAKADGTKLIENICTKKVITIFPDQSLMVAFHYLNKFKISRIPVVSRVNHKRLLGIMTAEDIVNRFGFHIQEEIKHGQTQLDKAYDELNQVKEELAEEKTPDNSNK